MQSPRHSVCWTHEKMVVRTQCRQERLQRPCNGPHRAQDSPHAFPADILERGGFSLASGRREGTLVAGEQNLG